MENVTNCSEYTITLFPICFENNNYNNMFDTVSRKSLNEIQKIDRKSENRR